MSQHHSRPQPHAHPYCRGDGPNRVSQEQHPSDLLFLELSERRHCREVDSRRRARFQQEHKLGRQRQASPTSKGRKDQRNDERNKQHPDDNNYAQLLETSPIDSPGRAGVGDLHPEDEEGSGNIPIFSRAFLRKPNGAPSSYTRGWIKGIRAILIEIKPKSTGGLRSALRSCFPTLSVSAPAGSGSSSLKFPTPIIPSEPSDLTLAINIHPTVHLATFMNAV